jgi:hypothetical protein
VTIRYELAAVGQLDVIRAAYEDGRQAQRLRGAAEWPEFSELSIRAEITEDRLWRVIEDETLIGVFTVAYADPAIWGDRETGRHLYLHRIARAAGSSTTGVFAKVLDWARAYCNEHACEGIRIDTWGSNDQLIAYYARFGFALVARVRLGSDPRLPVHYHGSELALLEQPLSARGTTHSS